MSSWCIADRSPFPSAFAAALGLAVAVSGCASIPKGSASVDALSIENNSEVSSSDIEAKLATTPSPKLFGLFRGVVYDYALFDRSVVARDIERLERYYRARGFYEARVRAGRVRYKEKDHVEVTLDVDEGPLTRIGAVHVAGVDGLSKRTKSAVIAALDRSLKPGDPFEEDPFESAHLAMERALTDRGYAWAKAERRADVDLGKHRAELFFDVTPGPKSRVGEVRIEGLRDLPERPLRRTIDIHPGDRYSTVALDRARDAVLALGTFSSVDIAPDLSAAPGPEAAVPIVVRVREQRPRSVLIGGGAELDALKAQAHLHLGWEDFNFLGAYRHFVVDLKPGIDLYPTRVPSFQAPTSILPEERFRVSLRQPGFLEPRMNGVTAHEINTYPILLSTQIDPKAPVIGYLEYKGQAGVERSIWKLFVSPSYNFQYDLPFSYKGTLDKALRAVAVSYVDLLGRFDFRDDRIHPHSGVYLADDFQFAGLGGNALDVRVQPEVRGYVPIGKKVTLATRATVGFVFPFNYGDAARAARMHEPVDRARWTEDLELIYLRGFFSGGPSSNRGYPLRGVGPHGVVPFFNPGAQADALAASCDFRNPSYDPLRCAVPLGGLSLWEASLELRFPIFDPLNAVVFVDASDVAPDRLTIRLNYPHLSAGVGLRIDTPIGPVRADLGYRIPGAQFPANIDPRTEGDPGSFFGVPFALAFGIGEAF